jgi:hypothetical protein
MERRTPTDDDRLRPHVGKRVEVTRRLRAALGSRAANDGPTATAGDGASSGSGAAGTTSEGTATSRRSRGEAGNAASGMNQLQAPSVRPVGRNCGGGR